MTKLAWDGKYKKHAARRMKQEYKGKKRCVGGPPCKTRSVARGREKECCLDQSDEEEICNAL